MFCVTYTEKSGRIVQLGGKVFNKTQQRYSMKDKEVLAVVQALEQLRLYIARAPFTTILCDNKGAIANFKNAEETSERAVRWIEKIQQFQKIDIEYVNTSKNVLADLSLTAEKLNMTHLLKPIYKVLEEGNQSMKWIKQYKEGLSIEDIMKRAVQDMIKGEEERI